MIITRLLRDAARRQRRLRLCGAAAEALTVLAAGALAGAAADRFLLPDPDTRQLLATLVQILALAWFVWRGVRSAWRTPSDRALARRADALNGDPACTITAAVELAVLPAPDTSPWMATRTRALAATAAAGLSAARMMPATACRRALTVLGAVLTLTIAVALLPGGLNHLGRGLMPWLAIARPSLVRLVVAPGDARLAAGAAFTITITCDPDPGSAQVEILRPGRHAGMMAAEPIADGAYRLRLGTVLEDFRYRVRAGDGESRLHQVTAVVLPHPRSIRCTTTEPAYAQRPLRQVEGGDVEVLAGGTVAIAVQFADEAPAAAAVVWEDGECALRPGPDGIWNARLDARRSCDWRLHLVVRGPTGAIDADLPETHRITVHPDADPTITLDGPGRIGGDGAALLSVTAGDDIGLAAIVVEAGLGGTTVPLPVTPPRRGERHCERRLVLDPTLLGVLPGETVELWAMATDCGGRQTRSAVKRLAVTERRAVAVELLANATAAAGEEARRQGDSLLRAARSWTQLANGGRAKDRTLTRNQARLASAIQGRAGRSLDNAGQRLVAAAVSAEDAGLDAARVRQSGEMLTRCGAEIAALAERTGATGIDAAAAYAALLDQWREELAALEARLALHDARWHGEVLVDTTQAALHHLRRDGDRLIAERAWNGPAGRPGLAGLFFRGPDAAGTPVAFETGLPAVNGDRPGLEPPWSARWSGEVSIPSAGWWTFSVLTDDGARLEVAGWSLLPTTAWTRQSPTEYRATMRLEAGWQLITITYNQLAGGAVLIVAAAPEGRTPAPIALERFRTAASAIDDATLDAMVRLRGSVAQAARRAGEDVVRLTAIATALPALIRTAEAPARIADEVLRARTRLPAGDLAAVEMLGLRDLQAAAAVIATTATQTRDLLLKRESALGDADGPRRRQQDDAERLMRRLALPEGGDLPAADRLRQGHALLRATALRLDHLATELDRLALAQRLVHGDADARALAWNAGLADAEACSAAREAAVAARLAAQSLDAAGLVRLAQDAAFATGRLRERLVVADARNQPVQRLVTAERARTALDGLLGLRSDVLAQVRLATARTAELATLLRRAGARELARRLVEAINQPDAATAVRSWCEALEAIAQAPATLDPPLRAAADAMDRAVNGLQANRAGATEQLQAGLLTAAAAAVLRGEREGSAEHAAVCRALAATLVAEARQPAMGRLDTVQSLIQKTRRLGDGILPERLDFPAAPAPLVDPLVQRFAALAAQSLAAAGDAALRPALAAALRAAGEPGNAVPAAPGDIHAGALAVPAIRAAILPFRQLAVDDAAGLALAAEADGIAAALGAGTVNAPTLRALAERIADHQARPIARLVRRGSADAATAGRGRAAAMLVGALDAAIAPLERRLVARSAPAAAITTLVTTEQRALEAMAAERDAATACRRSAAIFAAEAWSRHCDTLLASIGLSPATPTERGAALDLPAVGSAATAGDEDAAATWARPDSGVRSTIHAGSVDRFGTEHRAAIRDYLRRLAEEGR